MLIEEKHKRLWVQGADYLSALAAEVGTPQTAAPAGLRRQAVKADSEGQCCVCSTRVRVAEAVLYDEDARMSVGRRVTHLRCWGEKPTDVRGELWPVAAVDPIQFWRGHGGGVGQNLSGAPTSSPNRTVVGAG